MRVLTQEASAEKVGVSRRTVIAIESNQYNPSLDLAFKLARLFGVAIFRSSFMKRRVKQMPRYKVMGAGLYLAAIGDQRWTAPFCGYGMIIGYVRKNEICSDAKAGILR